MVWAKYFVYFYGVLDVASIFASVMGAVGSVGADPLAGISSLTTTLTEITKKFTALLPAGLLISSILNSSVTFWPMIYYRAKYELDPARVGAFYSTCEAFFYSWWIIGWLPTALSVADILMPAPFGSGTLTMWNGILIFYTAGEWLITCIVLSIVYPAFDTWFLRNRIAMSKVVLKKYDSAALEKKIRDEKEKDPVLKAREAKI